MSKNKFFISLAFLAVTFSQNIYSQIIKVGSDKTTVEEFKYTYEKNHSKDTNLYAQESLDQYKDLYIKFRLTVLEAQNQKLDTTPAFEKEFEGYKKQLAKPYFTDEEANKKLAKEAYTRTKKAVRASHILLMVAEDASPKDTLATYNKLLTIRDSIIKHGNFSTYAAQYSEDPSAKRPTGQAGSGGDLGYFSAFRMVYPFENAAYNTPKGQVSKPFRTQFGFHILQVTEVKVMDYKVQVAHIMINAPNDIPTEDSLKKAELINSIYLQASTGNNWNDLCSQYSEHGQTKNKGGIIPEFTVGGKIGLPTFELAAYELKNIGDISKPIKTNYGWHIIKLIAKTPFEPFEKVEKKYINLVKRDARSQKFEKLIIERIKVDNNFKEVDNITNLLDSLSDDNILKYRWKIEDHSSLVEEVLFTIDETPYTVYQFTEYLKNGQNAIKKSSPRAMMQKAYDNFVYQSNKDYEIMLLPSKHFEYKMLVKEFHDGILIYDIKKKEIWDKANEDTSGIKAYYNAHKVDFKLDDFILADVYTLTNATDTVQVKDLVQQGKSSDEILNALQNNKSKPTLTYSEQQIAKSGEFTKLLSWKANNEIEIISFKGKTLVIVKKQIHDNEYTPLNKVKGKVIAGYQKQLEEQFIASLRKKYKVKINKKEYKSLIKQ
ncbi:peptidylprolyl isomerase [Cyclobacteriaceae bacterium]|nr:peptidylprolyl isomerase [Cyclobacteriaceae bacterium]